MTASCNKKQRNNRDTKDRDNEKHCFPDVGGWCFFIIKNVYGGWKNEEENSDKYYACSCTIM